MLTVVAILTVTVAFAGAAHLNSGADLGLWIGLGAVISAMVVARDYHRQRKYPDLYRD